MFIAYSLLDTVGFLRCLFLWSVFSGNAKNVNLDHGRGQGAATDRDARQNARFSSHANNVEASKQV
jgi:hypothetical protein|tara:strand:- start:551 stop:748 length:198 start_codon:yes stop_codon:yes gene_type:complete